MDIRTDTNTTRRRRVIAFVGRFDAHECEAARTELDAALADIDVLEVDLEHVVFLDSTALAELVRASHQAEAKGVRFVLGQVSDPALVILELTGLDLAFERAESVRS